MLTNKSLLAVMAGFFMVLFPASQHASPPDTKTAAALTGQVTSAEEGPMEGVLVSARKAGSNITVTVVSNQEGRYAFPPTRLGPGE